jgi:hypothetical protein
MSYTVEDIVTSANLLVPSANRITPDKRLAMELVNDGLDEIQRKTGWYRLRANKTFTADQNYLSFITGAADYLDMIKLVDIYVGNIRQIVENDMDKIKALRSDGTLVRYQDNTLERIFALNLLPDNADFGTVYIEVWPAPSTEMTAIVEYETRPTLVTATTGTAGTIPVPRECMLYYLGYRLALNSDDNKRIVMFEAKFKDSCNRARSRRLTTRTKHRDPEYRGGLFDDVRSSRRPQR